MKRESRERFAQAGPIRDIARVPSGSPAVVKLRPAGELSAVRTIAATHALVRRGATKLAAKRAVERMVERGEAVLQLPTVEPGGGLVADLGDAGVAVAHVTDAPVDLPALRGRLRLTQEEFALL